MPAKKKQPSQPTNTDKQTNQVSALQAELAEANERLRRAQADYQNLERRMRDQRLELIQTASQSLIEELLEPLDHLRLATQSIDDQGLQMVVERLWQTLKDNGLEVIDPSGKPIDVATMEVVENQAEQGTPETKLRVLKVNSVGYRLNGRVIRHARVVVG